MITTGILSCISNSTEMVAGKAISTDSSANRLIEILQKNGFETGAHVGFADPL